MLEIKDIKFDEKTGRIAFMRGKFVLPQRRQSLA